MATILEQLAKRIRDNNGQLTEEVLQIPDVADYLRATFGVHRLDLDDTFDVTYDPGLPERVCVIGPAYVFGLSTMVVEIVFQETAGNVEFSIRSLADPARSHVFKEIQGHIFKGAFRIPIGFEKLSFKSFRMECKPKSKWAKFQIAAAGDLCLIPHDTNPLILKASGLEPSLALTISNLTSSEGEQANIDKAILTGVAQLGTHAVPVTADLSQGDPVRDVFRLTGLLKQVRFDILLGQLPSDPPNLPTDFPQTVIPDAVLELRFVGLQSLAIITADLDNNFGSLVVVSEEKKEKRHLVAGFFVKEDWSFEEISSNLASLDGTVNSPLIFASTLEDEHYKFPEAIGLDGREFYLPRGTSVLGALNLEKQALKLLRSMLQWVVHDDGQVEPLKTLPIAVEIGSTVSTVKIRSKEVKKIQVEKDFLFLQEFLIEVKPTLNFTVCSHAVTEIQNFPSIKAEMDFGLGNTQLAYLFSVGDWIDPLGIRNLTIKNTTIRLSAPQDPDGPKYLTGRIIVSDGKQFELSTHLQTRADGKQIWWLSGRLKGELDLQLLCQDLVRERLLNYRRMDIYIIDPKVYMRPPNTEKQHAGSISLAGKIKFFGCMTDSVTFKVEHGGGQEDPTKEGLVISAPLDDDISFGSYLRIKGNNGEGHPLVRASSASPAPEIHCAVYVFEELTNADVETTILNPISETEAGFKLPVSGKVFDKDHVTDFTLTCHVLPSEDGNRLESARLSGRMTCTTQLLFEDVKLADGVYAAVTFDNTTISGQMSALVTETGFNVDPIKTEFVLLQEKLSIETENLALTNSLKRIGRAVTEKARSKVKDHLGKLTSSEDELLAFVHDHTVSFPGDDEHHTIGSRSLAKAMQELFETKPRPFAFAVIRRLEWDHISVAHGLGQLLGDLEWDPRCFEIASILGEALDEPDTEHNKIAEALSSISPEDPIQSYRAALGIGKALKEFFHGAARIAEGLSHISVKQRDIALMLRNELAFDKHNEITCALAKVGVSREELAEWMRDPKVLDFPKPEEIATGLQAAFRNISFAEVAQILFDPEHLNYGYPGTALGLRSIGASIDVNRSILKELGATEDLIRAALEYAGYSEQASKEDV